MLKTCKFHISLLIFQLQQSVFLPIFLFFNYSNQSPIFTFSAACRWLIRFKWFACSPTKNETFRKYDTECCLKLEGAGVENQPFGALCAERFQKWRNALECSVDHETTKYHRNSMVTADTTMLMLLDSIATQLNLQTKQQILDNLKNYPYFRNNYTFGRLEIRFAGQQNSAPLT